VRAYRAVRQLKTLLHACKWHHRQKMPQSAFPLSRSHSYTLGSSWTWCVCELAAGPDRYRLLVGFDPMKEQYRAWLALVCGHDQAVLARLEFHPSHKGWHCHVKKGPVAEVARGVVKEARNPDRSRGCNTSEAFTVSETDALTLAFRVFNVFPETQFREGRLV
jgi:hypothetical protein